MRVLSDQKQRLQINEFNAQAADCIQLVLQEEKLFASRIENAAMEIDLSGSNVVLLSGPSGSGKTTTSLKLAKALTARGREAKVISLDDFFKNYEDYPLTCDGKKDLESVYAVDIDLVNSKLYDLVTSGRAVTPQYDFIMQKRKPEYKEIILKEDGIAVIEGIHALNPLLSESINRDEAFRIYAGLCVEYYEGEERIISTRDIRITRRMIRDFYFRGFSIERTLELWDNLVEGEKKWIRVFKTQADHIINTSINYEVSVFKELIDGIYADDTQGGEYRGLLEEIKKRFVRIVPMAEEITPDNSMLREFLGGLIL